MLASRTDVASGVEPFGHADREDTCRSRWSSGRMGQVMIAMDPHKRSATIVKLDERERVLRVARFGTDSDGYRGLLAAERPIGFGRGHGRP
jgi:hypothetical protein